MKLATGPRPPGIWGACLCFLIAGLWALISGLSNLAASQVAYTSAFPGFEWNRDWAIVALSAEFTIALIPIVWIFLVARPFARWMVSALGVWKLYWLIGGGAGEWVQAGLIVISIALLFMPDSNRYFRQA